MMKFLKKVKIFLKRTQVKIKKVIWVWEKEKMRAVLITIIFFIIIAFILNTFTLQAGSDENVSGWAWSENIGWISFNSISDHSIVNYGVSVDPLTGKFSGYAWSENIGWISFNRNDTGAPPSDDPCPDGSCIAKIEDLSNLGKKNVKVIGWARALSHGDGWDGWIKFNHGQGSGVYIDPSGDFHGWAWSDMVVGWISFNSSDPGASGGAHYKVTLNLSLSLPCSVTLTSDLAKDWIWQTKPLTLTWNSENASQCRRWIEVWNPFENVRLINTSFGDKIPYDNWTSDWNDELSGTITTYPGSGPPDPQTGSQPRNWIGKLWIYIVECKDLSGQNTKKAYLEVNVKPRPIWQEVIVW